MKKFFMAIIAILIAAGGCDPIMADWHPFTHSSTARTDIYGPVYPSGPGE